MSAQHSSASRRRLLASAAGLSGAALATTVCAAGEAAAADTGAGRLNVKNYGALGDDGADDAPAVQSAVDTAGQGGTVHLPPGKYHIASPLRLSLGVTLRGDWNPHFPDRTHLADSYIRPAYHPYFDGDALIVITPAPVEDTYYKSAYRGGPRLYGLALRGCPEDRTRVLNKSDGAIEGIRIDPGVKDVGMDKVTIWRVSGNGVNAQNAAAFQLNQVHCVVPPAPPSASRESQGTPRPWPG